MTPEAHALHRLLTDPVVRGQRIERSVRTYADNDSPGAAWAKRRANELGGCYAVRIGRKWFAVRGSTLITVEQHELLERTFGNTHGVAPA